MPSAANMNSEAANPCPSCGALPCDQCENPWAKFPWIVHFDMAHHPRFLIDDRDPLNTDMFSGYRINGAGKISATKAIGSGQGGRLAFHRSHFVEELPQ